MSKDEKQKFILQNSRIYCRWHALLAMLCLSPSRDLFSLSLIANFEWMPKYRMWAYKLQLPKYGNGLSRNNSELEAGKQGQTFVDCHLFFSLRPEHAMFWRIKSYLTYIVSIWGLCFCLNLMGISNFSILKSPVLKSPILKSPLSKSLIFKSPLSKSLKLMSPLLKSLMLKSPKFKSTWLKSLISKSHTTLRLVFCCVHLGFMFLFDSDGNFYGFTALKK